MPTVSIPAYRRHLHLVWYKYSNESYDIVINGNELLGQDRQPVVCHGLISKGSGVNLKSLVLRVARIKWLGYLRLTSSPRGSSSALVS